MNISKLHNAVAVVCPISGISIGDATDKTTWTFKATESATAEQIAAAQSVIDNADLSMLDDVVYYSPREFKNKFTLSEQDAILSSTDPQVKRIWLDLVTASVIDIEDEDTISGVTYLVAIGLLTESRKAEILT